MTELRGVREQDIVVMYEERSSFPFSHLSLEQTSLNLSPCYFAVILDLTIVSLDFCQNMSFLTSLNSSLNLPSKSPAWPTSSPSKTSSYLHRPSALMFHCLPHRAPTIL